MLPPNHRFFRIIDRRHYFRLNPLEEIELPNSNCRAFTGYEPKFLGCILHALIISVASILGIGKDVVVANLGNKAFSIVTVI